MGRKPTTRSDRLAMENCLRDLVKKQQQQITDLEAKLAESDKENKKLEEKLKFITEETNENFVDGQKYDQLKQQLENLNKEFELAQEHNEKKRLNTGKTNVHNSNINFLSQD